MKLKLLLSACILTLLPFNVYAQEVDIYEENQQAVISDVEGLRVEFKENTQNPDNKEIVYELILKSGIDSDRVKLTWSIRGSSIIKEGEEKIINTTVAKGESYTFPITLIPQGNGVSELVGKVEAFKADSSYLATVRKNFASNESSEVLPLTDSYNQSKTLSIIKNVVIVLVIVVIALLAGFFVLKKFVKWYNN